MQSVAHQVAAVNCWHRDGHQMHLAILGNRKVNGTARTQTINSIQLKRC